MRSLSSRWLVLGFLTVLFALAGCATDEKTINRVQPDGAIQKSLLTAGEWYTHTTVIDTDYGAMTFVGDGDSFQRIKFEIERDFLVARRSEEWIRGAEGDVGTAGDDTVKSAIVAMFPILSHFDIKREYNPVTGEEQNVISENTTDRPWFEREFIRVDWKDNRVKDLQFSVTGGMGGINLLPVTAWDQSEEEDDSYRPVFERNDAGELAYFDVVNKYFAEPGTIQGLPACLLIVGMHKDCAPGHIFTRRSFLKVEDRDYQPMVYTTDRMDHFGYFLNMRDGYDRGYGVSRFNRNRFVARHNIWKSSHKYEGEGEARKVKGCVKDSDCGGGGSVCDVAWAEAYGGAGACTLPHREREIRPIAYRLSENFPEDLEVDAADLVNEWNGAFKETVASLRRVECEENRGKDCAKYTPGNTQDVFVLCHNPVKEGDSEACGTAGTIARIGDLRYHFLSWVIEPQTTSPLGFGPSFTDPYTGEIINATAYVYGAPLDVYSAQARDLVAMLQGDLDPTSLQEDAEFESWIRFLGAQKEREELATTEAEFHTVKMDAADVAAANASMDFSWLESRIESRIGKAQPAQSMEEIAARLKNLKKAIGDIGETMALRQKGEANLKRLIGTDIEQLMIDDETYALANQVPPSLFPNSELTPEQIEQFSPLRGGSARGFAALNDARRMISQGRQHCLLEHEFADAGLVGLVRAIDDAARKGTTIKWYGREYKVHKTVNGRRKIDYDLVRSMIRHPIFHAVTAHEVGHTLGLRHNFSGSFDAINYMPEYWKLRDDGNMKPRLWDPMTSAEIKGRIREHQYSTVMDYGHNFIVTDSNGVGHYDRAAIKMGYGDLAEVFTKVPAANVEKVAALAVQSSSGTLGLISPDFLDGEAKLIAYTDWPALVGGVENLEARKDVRYTSLEQVRSQLFGTSQRAITKDGKYPVVPYNYCGDEFADFRPDCLRYDAGADPYETLQSVIDGYWEYYPLSHFMRQRIGFDPDAIKARTADRFFSKLESANRIYSFYRGIFPDLIRATTPPAIIENREGELPADRQARQAAADAEREVRVQEAIKEFLEGPSGLGAYTAGVRASYDLLRQVIATPEPTLYVESKRPDGSVALVQGGQSLLDTEIDAFNGRYLRSGYDIGPDFSWIFFTRAGWFHDKALAIETMLLANASFIGQDTDTDSRQFSTSFYTTFPNETNELLRGIIGNDWSSFAPRRLATGDLEYPKYDQVLKRGVGMSGTVLDPNVGFTLQMTAMAYAASFVPTSFEQDYANKARIFAKGAGEAIDLSVPTIEWTDPKSGVTFVAGSYLDADGVERGVGAAMLSWAKALQAAGKTDELADWVDNINIQRRVTWMTGFGQPVYQ